MRPTVSPWKCQILQSQVWDTTDKQVTRLKDCEHLNYKVLEAMENFVFPDEIKTKSMKMSKLKNIFYVP